MNGDGDLDAARQLAGLSIEALWYAYIGLGGSMSMSKMESGLMDPGSFSAHEHDVVAQAINEQFMDTGFNHPVPYWRPS